MSQQQDSCISVRSLFEVERRLSAPLYQRKFSWRKNNLDDFWDDVKLVKDDVSETLFLGAIILKFEGSSDPGTGKLEEFLVLDGQQRIGTLYLMLLAIALEWQEHGYTDEATAIAEEFLISTRTRSKGVTRFIPTIPDRPEFFSLCRKLKVDWDEEVLVNTEFRPAKLSEALERAQLEISKLCRDSSGFDSEALSDLGRILVDKIEIATINIGVRHQPNEVFDRLNRKGQPLTVGDLVKNEIFRRLGAETETALRLYRDLWEPFENLFDDQKQLDNYYYPFTLTVEPTATVGRSFRVLSEHWSSLIRDEQDSATAAELIIESLGEFVQEYNALSAGDDYATATSEVQVCVKRLHRMPAPRVTYAFLMQLLRDYRAEELGESETIKCLNIVETFLVRRAFSGLEPTGLHAVFKGLWNKNRGDPTSLVSHLQTRTVSFPDDEEFIKDIKSKPFYGRRLDGYVLSELEIAVHRSNPFTPEQLDAITVDHLAPQSLKGEWKKMFPKDKGEREMLLGLLGNLVPLSQSDNSTKQAADWNEACCRLRNETIYRTAREVLDQYTVWGPEQIQERTIQLAELAVNRWPRQG